MHKPRKITTHSRASQYVNDNNTYEELHSIMQKDKFSKMNCIIHIISMKECHLGPTGKGKCTNTINLLPFIVWGI